MWTFNFLTARYRRQMTLATFLALVVIAAVASLAGCAQTVTDSNGNTTTVVMTPSQLAAEAKVVVNAFSAGVAAYEVQAPTSVSPDLQAKITAAEAQANSLITVIASADVLTAATDAQSVANGLATVAEQIPNLPPDVRAGLIGFQVLVAALQPIINPVSPAPAALGLGPVSAPKLGTVKAGTVLRVRLVPNA